MSTFRFETNGEHFARYLLNHHLSGAQPERWRGVTEALEPTKRATDWVQAIQEMTSLQLARRLIGAGAILYEKFGADAAEREIKQMVIDTMLVHYTSAGEIYERLTPAIRSSRSKISDTTRLEISSFAKRQMPYCYLCGAEMDFVSDGPSKFTIDHVWPRAYGGESIVDNLLGACAQCNGLKSDTPSWALYPIQSYFAGFQSNAIANRPKTMPFAVRAKQASELAVSLNLSLRDAYIQLGRPSDLSIRDTDMAADFFNLDMNQLLET